MTAKTISVVMSVFNNEDYLASAIESILSQTFTDFELIITDDASTDNSSQIINHYTKLDKRIVFKKNEHNIGLTKNLNSMLSIARGKYIARMDGDDICDCQRFEKQVDILLKYSDIDVVFTDVVLIDTEGNKICKKWIPQSIDRILSLMPIFSYIAHPSVMIRQDIFRRYGVYDERYVVAQDWELWLRLIKNNINFYYLKLPLLHYRIHKNSITASRTYSHNKHNLISKYKLATICLNNIQYKEALKYWSVLTFLERALILTRILIPPALIRWRSYFLRRYHPNSIIKKLHQQ